MKSNLDGLSTDSSARSSRDVCHGRRNAALPITPHSQVVPGTKCRVGNDAILERLLPLPVKLGIADRCRPVLPPVAADDFVARPVDALEQSRKNFLCRSAAVERSDQRLNDRRGSIERSPIAPRFEKMSLREYASHTSCRLIGVEAQVNSERNVCRCFANSKSTGAVEDRIAAKNQQQSHFSGRHFLRPASPSRDLIRRSSVDRIDISDGLVDISQRIVDGMHHGVHFGQLIVASRDDASTAVRLEIMGDGGNPFANTIGRRDFRLKTGNA